MVEREWFDKDYYKVLGLTSSATEKEITRAYRKLAKSSHPDTNPGSEEKFKEVSVAYDVLGDKEKRKEYDEVRRLGPAAAGFGGPGAQGAGGFNFQTGDFGDLGDLFGGLFGGGRRQRAQRGADLETALHLGFRDAVDGRDDVGEPAEQRGVPHLSRGVAPRPAPASSPVNAAAVAASSTTTRDRSRCRASVRSVRVAAGGSRHRVPTCHGTGREPSSRKVNVRIPGRASTTDNESRSRARAIPARRAARPATSSSTCTCRPTPRFDRRGRNVTTTVNVPLTAAMLGTTVEVPTLDEPVTLKVPAGTQPSTTMRVRGRGVPASGKNAAGDLLVTDERHDPQEAEQGTEVPRSRSWPSR